MSNMRPKWEKRESASVVGSDTTGPRQVCTNIHDDSRTRYSLVSSIDILLDAGCWKVHMLEIELIAQPENYG